MSGNGPGPNGPVYESQYNGGFNAGANSPYGGGYAGFPNGNQPYPGQNGPQSNPQPVQAGSSFQLAAGLTPQAYQKEIKSEFLKSHLLQESKSPVNVSKLGGDDYVKSQFTNPQVSALADPLKLPDPALDLKVEAKAAVSASSAQMKSGFCGKSLKRITSNLTTNEKGILELQPTVKGEKPIPFDGDFGILKVAELAPLMAKQKDPTRQKDTTGENAHMQIIPPSEGYKYVLRFAKTVGNDPKNTEQICVFFKDEADVERFKNSMLFNSNLGSNFVKTPADKVGAPCKLKDYIQRRKGLIAESVLETAFIRQRNEFNKANGPKREVLPLARRRLILRKSILRRHIKEELNTTKTDDEKRKAAIMRLYRNMATRGDENMKMYGYTTWVTAMKDARQRELMNIKSQLIVVPKKYYNLGPQPRDPNNLKTQVMENLIIVIAQSPKDEDNVEADTYPDAQTIAVEKLALPYGADVIVTEYNLVSMNGTIDLTKFVGYYLVAYTKDLVKRKVTAIGNVRISEKLEEVIRIDLANKNNISAVNNQKIPLGAVFFRRPGMKGAIDKDPLFEELIHPENFGYLKKLQLGLLKDMGISSLSNPVGTGKRYENIRDFLAADVRLNKTLSQYETDVFKNVEWRDYESIIKWLNGKAFEAFSQSANPPVIVFNQRNYQTQMEKSQMSELLPINHSDEAFLFFSVENWTKFDMYAKNSHFTKKALMTGMPNYLYVPVWKSLGKAPLVKQIVVNILKYKLPGFNPNASILEQLAKAGASELNHNPNIERDLAELDSFFGFTTATFNLIKSTLCAYLKLSLIMEDISNDPEDARNVNLLKGFSLKVVVGLVNIVKHLVTLVTHTQRFKGRDPRVNDVTDEDIFTLLLSIAFVFLPEHFMNPLLNFKISKGSQNYFDCLKRLGIPLEDYLKNKTFAGTSAIGGYKLSLLTAQMINKEIPSVYSKMTDLGFPFLTYSLTLTESLFTDFFHPDMLNKLWTMIFFEGSNQYKRRAQQILLSALVCNIKMARKEILDSRSAEEVRWHMRAWAYFNYETTQFLKDTLRIRKLYFVKDQDNSGFLGGLNRFFAGAKTLEEELQNIKDEISVDYDSVVAGNLALMTFIRQMVEALEKKGQAIDFLHLRRFVESLIVKTDSDDNKCKLHFTHEFHQNEYPLNIKPTVQNVQISLASWDFGNFLPESTILTISPSFRRDTVLLKSNNSNWFKVHKFDGSLISQINQAWIDVKVDSFDRNGKPYSFDRKIALEKFRFNKDGYTTLKFSTMWIVLQVKVTSAEIKTEGTDFLKNMDIDRQHRQSLFVETFADHMGITKETPYKEELLNNSTTKQFLPLLTAYAYRMDKVEFSSDVLKTVVNVDLVGKNVPNLFEFLVRLIMFSPMDNLSTLKSLFTVLNRLDLAYESNKVKRTHVEFLIWYILRISQIYVPYMEIVTSVSLLLNRKESGIVSAVVTSPQDMRSPSLDITELLNVWMIAERRRTGKALIKLGSNGYLNNLKKAINHWQQENGLSPYIFAGVNKLRVLMSCQGVVRKVEFKFDDTMRIIFDQKDRDIPIESEHVLLMEDTEQSIGIGQFIEVMSRFQILDWIFSRLSGLGNDNSYQVHSRKIKEKEMKESQNYEVNIKFFSYDPTGGQPQSDLGSVTMGKMVEFRLLDLKVQSDKLDFLIDNQRKIDYGNQVPTVKDFNILTDNTLMREALSEARRQAANELIQKVNTSSYSFQYKQECLRLLTLSLEDATVLLNKRRVDLDKMELPMKKIAEFFKSQPKLEIEVAVKKEALSPIYNHMAKDIYYLEGVNVVENPLVPCMIIDRNSTFAEVIFENDDEKRTVAIEDAIMTDR